MGRFRSGALLLRSCRPGDPDRQRRSASGPGQPPRRRRARSRSRRERAVRRPQTPSRPRSTRQLPLSAPGAGAVTAAASTTSRRSSGQGCLLWPGPRFSAGAGIRWLPHPSTGRFGRRRSRPRRFAEEHLPGEYAPRTLGDDHLRAVDLHRPPLGPDGEDVLLDRQVDGVSTDAGQVEVDVEGVAIAVGIHRHRGRPGGCSEELLGEPVEVTERVGTHKHR